MEKLWNIHDLLSAARKVAEDTKDAEMLVYLISIALAEADQEIADKRKLQ